MATGNEETSLKCADCGSQDFVVDGCDQVCVDCGNVLEQQVLDKDGPTSSINMVTSKKDAVQLDLNWNTVACSNDKVKKYFRSYTSSLVPWMSNLVKLGVQNIKQVCKLMNLSRSVQDTAIEMFKEIVKHEAFKNDVSVKKQCLALCCIYLVVCRQGDPITLMEISKHTDVNMRHLGSILFRVQRVFPNYFTKTSRWLELLVSFYVFKYMNAMAGKHKQILVETGESLVWMWQQCFLVQGYDPNSVIYAAMFFAYKATFPNECKLKLHSFLSKFNMMASQRLVSCRVRLYNQALIDFYTRCHPLAIVTEDCPLDEDTISLKIKDILNVKRLIVMNYILAKESMPSFQMRMQPKKESKAHEGDTDSCKRSSDFLDNDDEEISDSEIDMYIRDEKEIQDLERLNKKIKSS